VGVFAGAEERDDVRVADSREDARLLAQERGLLFGDRRDEALHADLAHEGAAALACAVDVGDAAAADEIEELEALDRFCGCRGDRVRALHDGLIGHTLIVGTGGPKLRGFVVSLRRRTIDRPRPPRASSTGTSLVFELAGPRRTMNASP